MHICITNTTTVLFIIAAVAKDVSSSLVRSVKSKVKNIDLRSHSSFSISSVHALALVLEKERIQKKTTTEEPRSGATVTVTTRDGFYSLSEKSIMHVMKSSLSGFLCSYVCATVSEWHCGVSLSAVPRSRGPALVVFLGATHTCVVSFLCPLCASNLRTKNK